MAELLLYDYSEIITDPWFGDYEVSYCIGQGKLSAGVVVPFIENQTGELVVRIASCGGMMWDSWSIYNALHGYMKKPGNNVVMRIEGVCASAASIIAMAANKVIMCQASVLMIHKAKTLPYEWMDANDYQREADALNQMESVNTDIYAAKTGLSKQKLQNMIDAETWLSPDVALSLGFCDEVEKIEREAPAISQTVFNKLFTSDSAAKAYVNSAFTIKQEKPKNMSTVSVKDLVEKQETTNSLLKDVLNFFKAKPKNEAETTEETKVEETTEVKTEETKVETTAPDELAELKKENQRLKDEATANQEKVTQADEVLNKANAKFDEVTNLLSEIKSTYKPKGDESTGPVSKVTGTEENSKFIKPNKK